MKSFIHTGKIGDVLSSLPVVREMGGGELYLKADFSIDFTPDAALALAPLLDVQEYVQARIWEKEKADIDLDLFRHTVLKLNRSDMRRWYIHTFNVHPDLSQPFLSVPPAPGFENAVVVGRSLRYHNNLITYKFLQDKHFERVVFLGNRQEFGFFKGEVRRAEYVQTPDLLAAARVIEGSRLFLGNQSSLWWVAEGLGHHRILEIYPEAPNCLPLTPNGYDAVYGPFFSDLAKKVYARVPSLSCPPSSPWESPTASLLCPCCTTPEVFHHR